AYQAPSAAAARIRSRAVKKLSGTPSASMSASGTPASAPVTEACMLNTSAVAPLPRASSYATRAYVPKPAPAPPSRSGTMSPNSPDSRRSVKSSTGNVPSRSYRAARSANRGTSRRAGTQNPARVGDGTAQVGHVLQQFAGAHHVGAAVGERQPGDVGPDRFDAVRARLPQRRGDQVDPHVPVPLAGHVRGEQSAAA